MSIPSSSSRFRPNRISIKWKVFLPVAGIVLAASLVYAYVGLHAAENQLKGRMDRTAAVLSAMVERVIRPAVRREDTATLNRMLNDLEGMPDLLGLRVYRPNGKSWVGRDIDKIGPHLDPKPLRFRALTKESGHASVLSNGNLYVVRVIRRSESHPSSEPAGFLEMELSMEDTLQQVRANRRQLTLVMGACLVFLAFSIMIIIQVLVSSPLTELTRTMSRVEAGDMKARAEIRSGDELERMGHSFNRMVEEIEHKNEQLVEAGEQLLKKEKLASIGLLAAGVAHEINNPVATISMSAEGLMETESSPERKRFLRAIIEESERISLIVRNLLGFERGGHTAYEPCSLSEIVREAVSDLEWEAERAKVVVSVDLDLPQDTILGQADQLRQAFLNIIDNALRAMTQGGRLQIAARQEEGNVLVHFCDSGPGIPKEHQKRIFDPFFTTREVGEGFGLGLAACYEIVKRHNGDITVDSGPGGTTFSIELPLINNGVQSSEFAIQS